MNRRTETDPEYMTNVRIIVRATEKADAICSALRGLLYSIGNNNGAMMKTQQFRKGVVIGFGTGPMARDFIVTAKWLISKDALRKIDLELIG